MIAFIGGGNMARSLIGGLIADGCDSKHLWVADPDQQQRHSLEKNFGVNTAATNNDAVAQADVVVFAVKPDVLKTVAMDLASTIQQRQALVITIAAGIRTTDLKTWLGSHTHIVRAMPNIAALIKCSATALYADNQVSDQHRDRAESILRAVGLTLWLEQEAQMDAVTALSGSGPAYFLLVMEAIENAGYKLGLPRDTARLLTLQTAFGAAKMALESAEDSATLRKHVTSPGGTTERAIEVLEHGEFQKLFNSALQAANDRAIELANHLGRE